MLRILRFLKIVALLLAASSALAGSYDDMLDAVKQDDLPTVEALLARGMDVDTTDANANTLLMIATQEHRIGMARRLLQANAKVGARNRYGETALMLAAADGNPEMVKLMLDHGASINISGWNPLIYAAWRGHTEVVKYLLDKGAEVDAVSPDGITALMMATRDGHMDTVRLLLWELADPNLRSRSGTTALDWALKAGNTELAELLKQVGAEESAK